MSEIADVLNFLSQVVKTTLNFGVDVISTILLAASAILPWRWSEIHFLIHYAAKPWKSRCLASFFLTVFDLVAFPGLLFGFISPMRFSSTLKKVKLYIYNEGQSIGNLFDKRYEAIGVLIMTCFDLICLPFGFLTLFSPFGRQVALFIVITTSPYIDTQYSDYSDATALSATFFYYGISTMIDILVFIISAPFLLIVFSTWSKLQTWIRVAIRDEIPQVLSAATVQFSIKRYAIGWNEFICKLREVVLAVLLLALLDIVAVIPFLLAFASPLRHQELMNLVFGNNNNQHPHQQVTQHQVEIGEVAVNTAAAAAAAADVNDIEVHAVVLVPAPAPAAAVAVGESINDQFPACYELRFAVIQLGGLALADFILYPMIFVLWVTHYRYHCIASALTGTNHWGNDELWLVTSHFFYLVLDVFVFSFPMAILFVTRIRWQEVKEKLASPHVLSRDTPSLYSLISLQFLYLIVDVCTLPFVLIVCCTYYRFASVVSPILFHPRVWRHGLLINKVFFLNGLFVMHDLIFLLPFILSNVAILSIHRLYCMYHAYHEAHLAMIANRERLMIEQDNTNILSLDALESLAEIDFEIRCVIWTNAISAFLDLPFVFMGLLTLLSIWRTNELVNGTNREMNRNVDQNYYHPAMSRKLMIHFGHVRVIIFRQFLSLLIDFAALIPFTITIATVYKMPQMITDLIALYFERGAIKGQPLFTVKRAQVTWKAKNDPHISMNIERVVVSSAEQVFDVNAISGFQLQVMGNEIWKQTSKQLGSLITSVIKASLPLKLQQTETVGLVYSKALELLSSEAAAAAAVEEEPRSGLAVWMKLPFGSLVKRSTMLKKLKKITSATIICVQLGCTLPPLSVNNTSEESKDVPLTYLRLTVEQLIKGLSSPDDTFDLQCCTETIDYAAFDNQPVVAKVDRFTPIVMSSFLVVLKDFAHILLLLALMFFSPPRFLQCIVRMFSSDHSLRVDIGRKMWLALMECEYHLLRLRSMFSPILNENNKNSHRFRSAGREDNDLPESREEFCRDCVYHLSRYRFQNKYILSHLKLLNNIEDDIGTMDKTVIASLFDSHDQMMNWFFARYQIWTFTEDRASRIGSEYQRQHDLDTHRKLVLLSMVCAEEHDYVVREMLVKRQAVERFLLPLPVSDNPPPTQGNTEEGRVIREAVSSNQDEKNDNEDGKTEEATRVKTSTTNEQSTTKHSSWCLKLNKHTQSIIRSQAQRMVSDWVGIAMLIMLILTVVRIIPLLLDIKQKSRHLTYKSLFIRHFHNVLSDLFHIGSLIVAWILLCITIVGIPEYLEDFAEHLSSWPDAAKCAWTHVEDALVSIWELFTLLTAFKTYRVLGKSILYCLFLPGASIASILGNDPDSLSFRFTIGTIVFAAVMAGAIVVANHEDLQDHAKWMNYSFLGVIGAVVVIQSLVILLKHCSDGTTRERTNIASRSLSLRLSWNHVFGLLLGPIECLLLSSMILYFYWNSQDMNQGQDNLSYLLFWREEGNNSSSKGIMQTAVTIAGALVLLWAVLIAIPLAQGSNDVAHRRDKIHAVLAQPAYRTLNHFLSSTIGVWIIAALMRPTSCVEDVADSVMSTAVTSQCGTGNEYGMSHASLAFLAYFLITTSLVQPDFYEPRTQNDAYDTVSAHRISNSFLEWHSLYMLQVRTVQTIVCALCFGLVGQSQTTNTIILAVILAITLLAALLPLCYQACCNVSSILSLRMFSYLAVAWTALVCLIRSQVNDSRLSEIVVFSTEGTIYIGWEILYTFAIAFIIFNELRRRAQWLQAMHDSGLIDAIGSLVNLFEIISLDFSLRRRKQVAANNDLQQLGNRIQQHCDSLPAIIVFVKELERLIPVDRLSFDFMLRRFQWLRSLQSVVDGHRELIESNAMMVAGDQVNAATEDRLEEGRTTTTTNSRQQVVQQVMNHMTILRMGFEEPLASSHSMSRNVLAAVLSYRGVPREVSMIIHSYMLNLQPLRNILIFQDFPHGNGGYYTTSIEREVSTLQLNEVSNNDEVARVQDRTTWQEDPLQRAARRQRPWSRLLTFNKKEYFSDMCLTVSRGVYYPISAAMHLPPINTTDDEIQFLQA